MTVPPAAPDDQPAITPGRRPAAVLVPIYDGPDGPTVVMIRRTARGHHSGQFAFPGGRPEAVDIDLCATATREAYEEVGINPADVTILGSLPTVETITTNYAITAYVGRLGSPPVLVRQPDEVAEILEIPLATFLAPDCQSLKNGTCRFQVNRGRHRQRARHRNSGGAQSASIRGERTASGARPPG